MVQIPFRYPGGKFYALKYLEPFWSSIDHDEYREPFVGGGSVFFAKNKVAHNWINDIDENLIITYKIMSDPKKREKLITLLEKEIATKERWREIFNFIPKTILEKAYRYFYLNRTSFSGKMVSPAWGYRPKRSIPPERWHEKIRPCGKQLEGVNITSGDFETVITAKANGKSVLLFVDPPYYKPPKKKHYTNGFAIEDHVRLAKLLKSTKHAFILTYEDASEVRALYQWANIYPIEFFYRVHNSNTEDGKRKVGKEVVITNFKVKFSEALK